MHDKHVAEHGINCLSCHLRIEHSFDKERLAHTVGDCAACHPDHHQEQIKMFEGLGGQTIPGHAGGMMVSRVSCRTCHRFKEITPSGAVLWKSSAEVCSMCHDPSEVERLRSYHEVLRAALPELQSALLGARKALPQAKLPEERAAAAAKDLDRLQADLDFLRKGNDIHNIHYASELMRELLKQVSQLCRELKAPEPTVVLPPAEKPRSPAEKPPPSTEKPSPSAEKPPP
jgi:hypothetical protein